MDETNGQRSQQNNGSKRNGDGHSHANGSAGYGKGGLPEKGATEASFDFSRILLVDDDDFMRERLARALRSRNFIVHTAVDGPSALTAIEDFAAEAFVVDLKMPGMDGLELVRKIAETQPGLRIIVLTGYGSIASALEATRYGAMDYLTKPADTDQVLAALQGLRPQLAHPADGTEWESPTLDRVEWEHINRVLYDCEGNITQAARTLGIHRRSLQRKLARIPPSR